MKILYVTTVGVTMGFFTKFLQELIAEGNTVELACSEPKGIPEKLACCKVHTLSCSRSVFRLGNLKAIKQIKAVVDKGNYDIVHCHTPIAAACTRIACRKARKNGTKVIYTAHGFHFFQGAPWKNWLVFYPVEKLCSYLTDVLITINQEDFQLAKRKLKAKHTEYIPGVGIDVSRFRDAQVDKTQKREELNIPQDACVAFSVGELNENKNHITVIRALAEPELQGVHYMIAGQGSRKDFLLAEAEKLNVTNRVHLLGQRKDVPELYKIVDVYMHPSYREGLPVAVMEAMAAGLPCVGSNIRGVRDLIEEHKGGFLCESTDVRDFADKISSIFTSADTASRFSAYNTEKIMQFDSININDQMMGIYQKNTNNEGLN